MSGRKYKELEDRTTIFAKNVVRFCISLKKSDIKKPFINQIIRSSSSVGANYREANEARTYKEKIHILFIVKRELKETQYWLSLFEVFKDANNNQLSQLQKECDELLKIFMTIIFSFKSQEKRK